MEGAEGQAPEKPAEGQEPREPEKFDAEYVRKLRDEAASHRVRAKTLEEENAKLKGERLSEEERKAARLAELEKKEAEWEGRFKAQAIENAVLAQAASMNVIDPAAAYRLLDLTQVEFDADSGAVKGDSVKKALEALVKAKPYLKGAVRPPADGSSPANPPRPGAGAGEPGVKETDEQRRMRLYGGGGRVWDPEVIRARGGGVVFNPEVNPKQRPQGPE